MDEPIRRSFTEQELHDRAHLFMKQHLADEQKSNPDRYYAFYGLLSFFVEDLMEEPTEENLK